MYKFQMCQKRNKIGCRMSCVTLIIHNRLYFHVVFQKVVYFKRQTLYERFDFTVPKWEHQEDI